MISFGEGLQSMKVSNEDSLLDILTTTTSKHMFINETQISIGYWLLVIHINQAFIIQQLLANITT